MAWSFRRALALALAHVAVVAGASSCGDEPASSSAGSGGGGGDSSSSSSSGAPFSLCSTSAVGLLGTLDGEAIKASFPLLRTRVKGSLWQGFWQTEGHVVLFGESDLEMPGSSAAATGLLRMPEEGPHAGEWFCAGNGSSVTTGEDKTFSLAALARLGACSAGTPVEGTIEGCFGPDASLCPFGKKLTSTLKGAEFDWETAVTGWGGMPGVYEIFLDNGGILALYIELDTVLGGLLYIAPGSPDAGAVYCFGGGSLQPGAQSAIAFSLTGLSRLGTCADATPVGGAVEGCAD
ncbi:MAG: hypothetical protein HUU21_22995 [Polyangiaceae bacterium]|nr:hypothetical protein [Polyangiaceae bacterium]NUQ76416.1 hypothetical protein [Polyangiaceae bacterium]